VAPGRWDIIEAALMMERTATYLYCVVKAARRPPVGRAPRGLPGVTAPEAIDLGQSLWLIVADVPLDIYGPESLQSSLGNMQWVSDAAVAHDAVSEHFARMRNVTTVPMKMFTMFSTRERAAAEMRGRRRELGAAIRKIAGCEEWGVRVMREPAALVRAQSGASAATSGAAFLTAKKNLRDEARQAVVLAADAAEEAFSELSALARDVARRHDAPQGAAAPPLLDAAFLVPTSGRTRFKAAARRAARQCHDAGASMSLTGPWPAYNFVQSPETR
jgi:hypothetical protein